MKKMTLAFALLAALFCSAEAFAGGATQVRTEYCEMFHDHCCGNDVDICYDFHATIKDGQITHINASGKGTASDGTKYVLTAAINQHQKIHDNGGGNYTLAYNLNLNAVGGSKCGFKLKILIHVTMNSNGTITATVEKVSQECDNGIIH